MNKLMPKDVSDFKEVKEVIIIFITSCYLN